MGGDNHGRHELVAVVHIDIAVVPIQPTDLPPVAHPPKLLPIRPRGRHIRNTNRIGAAVEDRERRLLPVGLADFEVLELARADVAAASAAEDLLVVVVDADHLEAAVAAAGARASIERGTDAHVAGVGRLAGEEAREKAVDADCVGYDADDGDTCAHCGRWCGDFVRKTGKMWLWSTKLAGNQYR